MPVISPGLMWILAVVFAALFVGSLVRLIWLRFAPDAASKSYSRLMVWWVLLIAFTAACLAGKAGLSILFCLAGILAVNEFQQIFVRRANHSTDGGAATLDETVMYDRGLPVLGLLTSCMAVVHYAILAISNSFQSTWGIPLLLLVMLSTTEICLGVTRDYLRAAAGYFWVFVLVVFGVSHAVAVVGLPASDLEPLVGSVGWCLFLVFLTELNDISQALFGKQFGRNKIVPAISPGKSWEGLAGGLTVTVVLSNVLAPWLTSLGEGYAPWTAIAIASIAGVLISLGGFLGDLNISAIKREAGVKDSGDLLPGMGGMMDRIDSLTISAPAFYYFALAVTKSAPN